MYLFLGTWTIIIINSFSVNIRNVLQISIMKTIQIYIQNNVLKDHLVFYSKYNLPTTDGGTDFTW